MERPLSPPYSAAERHKAMPFSEDFGVRTHRQQRTALVAIAILLLGVGGASAWIPIGGAVIAGGRIGVESGVKKVAHPFGGVIKEVLVRNGQNVIKGQLLIKFDDTVIGADARFSSLNVQQLISQRARLEAERLGLAQISFPESLAPDDPAARDAMANEERMFRTRKAEQASIIAQLNIQIRQYEKQISAYRAQKYSLERQSALIEPERQGVKELWSKGLTTISRVNQLERAAAQIEGDLSALQSNIAQTRGLIAETHQKIIQVAESRRSEAGAQLSQVNMSLNQQHIRSVSATDAQERSLVRAQYGGTVDKLAFNTAGDVVRPAETIMEIVPKKDPLVVEAAVRPSDIEQVHIGQKARIRFARFNSTTTPEIVGRVVLVAADTAVIDGKGSFFLVRIAIDENGLKRYPELKLKPGMPAEVFISTRSRSLLSYITKPLRDQFDRAFRDN